MQEEKHYKTDRNINSKSFGVRIDNYLYDVLITFAEKHGKKKRCSNRSTRGLSLQARGRLEIFLCLLCVKFYMKHTPLRSLPA